MNRPIKRISLNLQKQNGQACFVAKLNDASKRIVIFLFDGGKPYVITEDCSAVFVATKPDGKQLYNRCQIENNAIIYDVTPQTVSVLGMYYAEVRIYGGEELQMVTPSFLVVVEPSQIIDESQIESSDEFSALTDAMARVETAIDTAEAYAEKALPKIGYVTVYASAWTGSDKTYSQVVTIDGVEVTEYSQVVLDLTAEQLVFFREKEVSFVTENDGGIITIVAVGDKLEEDYTFGVTVKEVEIGGETSDE